MHVIFAENLTGWLHNAAKIFAWIGALALSLLALFPAFFGNVKLTAVLVTPSLLLGAAILAVWLWACMSGQPATDRSHEGDAMWEAIAYGGLLPAAPSAVGICALCLAWFFRLAKDQKRR